jgi:hypothetical protein
MIESPSSNGGLDLVRAEASPRREGLLPSCRPVGIRRWVHPVRHSNFQRIPASLAIRFETLLPVINPAGNPPPGEIHWPTM